MEKSQGFIAISAVLVIMAVVVAITVTVSQLSIGEGQASLSLVKGEENLNLVEGCVEDYLLKIRANPGYSGGIIQRPEGSCTINIVSTNPNWDIIVLPVSTQYLRSIQVKFTRTGTQINLTSWSEV
jgi:hypothetical protein